jgi:hypothetical protein
VSSSRTLPPVYLNHFYAVLDSATYRALEESPFWRNRFAPNERRTTVRTDQTYTGLYFYGINTYFEFFDVANSPRPEVGDFGIAFGVDVAGGIDTLKARLGAELLVASDPITRLYRGEQIPWFFMGTFASLPYESRTSTWLMEYHPAFLAKWNPRPGSAEKGRAEERTAGGIQRRDVLRRYADVLEPNKDPYLEDVVGLTVAVEPLIRDLFVALLGRIGYEAQAGENGAVELRGPDFALRILTVEGGPGRGGVRQISMRTGRALPSAMPEQFGRSVVRGEERLVTLSFEAS